MTVLYTANVLICILYRYLHVVLRPIWAVTTPILEPASLSTLSRTTTATDVKKFQPSATLSFFMPPGYRRKWVYFMVYWFGWNMTIKARLTSSWNRHATSLCHDLCANEAVLWHKERIKCVQEAEPLRSKRDTAPQRSHCTLLRILFGSNLGQSKFSASSSRQQDVPNVMNGRSAVKPVKNWLPFCDNRRNIHVPSAFFYGVRDFWPNKEKLNNNTRDDQQRHETGDGWVYRRKRVSWTTCRLTTRMSHHYHLRCPHWNKFVDDELPIACLLAYILKQYFQDRVTKW